MKASSKYTFTKDEIADYVKRGAIADGKLPANKPFKILFKATSFEATPKDETFFDEFDNLFGGFYKAFGMKDKESALPADGKIDISVEFETLEKER